MTKEEFWDGGRPPVRRLAAGSYRGEAAEAADVVPLPGMLRIITSYRWERA